MYAIPEIREMAKRRVRTLHEMFWARTAVAPDPENRWYDRRVLELRAQIGDDAALDHAKWTPGPWKNAAPMTSVSPFKSHTMDQELARHFANYVVQRMNYVYAHGDMPVTQNLATLQPFSFPAIDASPVSGNQDQEFIQLSHTNAIAVDMSGWRLEGGVEFTFEPGTVIPPTGHFTSRRMSLLSKRARWHRAADRDCWSSATTAGISATSVRRSGSSILRGPSAPARLTQARRVSGNHHWS